MTASKNRKGCSMKKLTAALCVLALSIAAFAGEITVAGKGMVRLPPDKMRMAFEVSAMDLDIGTAKRVFAERTAALAATLAEAGVASNEVFTSGLAIENVIEYEHFQNGIPMKVTKGYRFLEEYTFIARLDRVRLEDIYSRLVAGEIVEGLSVHYEIFDIQTPMNTARNLAVKNAREIAEGIAAAAGVSLGEIDEIVYRGDGRIPVATSGALYDARIKCDESFGVEPVGSPSDITISDSVLITWKIK